MRRVRNKGLMQVMAVLMVFSFSSWVMAAGLIGARVIPSSKVAIYDGVKKVGEISNEAPLPEGKILSSNEKFGLKLDGIYLVATEKTKVAVSPISGGQDIFVQEGVVYFALAGIKNTLTFSSPQDSVTVQNVIVNASTSTPMIKGYVSFQNDQMEIAVLEGGQLMVVNARGQQVIDPGSRWMVLKAQADLGGGAGAGGGGMSPTALGLTLTGGALGVVVFGAILGAPSSGGTTSPFQP